MVKITRTFFYTIIQSVKVDFFSELFFSILVLGWVGYDSSLAVQICDYIVVIIWL